MRPGATRSETAPARWLDRIAALFALFLVVSPLIASDLAIPGLLNMARGVNTFLEQYKRHEPVFLAIMALFAIGAALLASRARAEQQSSSSGWDVPSHWGAGRLAAIAGIAFVVTAAGTWGVMHAFPFSMDEYVATFQARAFAEGRLAVPLPEEWRPFGKALTPVFVVYDADTHAWLSAYWPIYGLVRAVFLQFGADRLLNPLLAAASIPLVYACARQLWPAERSRAWLAVGFLVLSSQFLFMSMTGYAMSAHLVVNLAWVYAFARRDRAGWLAAPVIGIIALGLHNPFPHAMFVAPFLLQVLLERRWRWTLYFAAVYLAGIVVWYQWAQAVTAASAGGNLAGLFAMPGLLMLAVQELSLTVILSWQTPLLALLFVWTMFAWRSLTPTERCLAAGIVLPLVVFAFYPSTQGHGWGYRYVYPSLGSMALLGAVGLDRLRQAVGGAVVRRLLVASALVTVFVQLPVRAWQIERYVRPFARTHGHVARIDADVVIVDPTIVWYGIDLIRNDPFLRQRPKILSAFYLGPAHKRELAERFGHRVHLLTAEEIAPFGLTMYPSRFKRPPWPPDPLPAGP
ncbi:MAG TPA: hypothetical protein VFZ21_13555 [Gemmatimonadaceae bacterium]|nr:hypothetical protein [Gemmatimonadaceae bacterium]